MTPQSTMEPTRTATENRLSNGVVVLSYFGHQTFQRHVISARGLHALPLSEPRSLGSCASICYSIGEGTLVNQPFNLTIKDVHSAAYRWQEAHRLPGDPLSGSGVLDLYSSNPSSASPPSDLRLEKWMGQLQWAANR